MDEITLEDVPHILQQNLEKSNNPNILRVLNEHMSVRKGKFGAYIYYKTPEMAKPSFLNMKKFGYGFSTCEKEIFSLGIDPLVPCELFPTSTCAPKLSYK